MPDLIYSKRNKNIKKLIIFIFSITILIAFTGCSTIDSFRATFISKKTNIDDDVIYIGVYEPETGKQKEAGLEEIRGIELANKMYHYIKGKEVRLVIVDSKSSMSGARSAIESLVKIKPVAIIGNTGEGGSILASDYINDAKIPTITPSAKNLLITEGSEYYFRTCVTDSQIGEGLADFAWNKAEIRKFASIYFEGDSTAESLNNGINKKLNELNNNISPIEEEFEVKIGKIKYDQIVKDIKKKGEGAKVAVRNIRRDAMDHFKKVGKAEDISEDEIKDLEDGIQKLTDQYVAQIDKAVDAKSDEILTV